MADKKNLPTFELPLWRFPFGIGKWFTKHWFRYRNVTVWQDGTERKLRSGLALIWVKTHEDQDRDKHTGKVSPLRLFQFLYACHSSRLHRFKEPYRPPVGFIMVFEELDPERQEVISTGFRFISLDAAPPVFEIYGHGADLREHSAIRAELKRAREAS